VKTSCLGLVQGLGGAGLGQAVEAAERCENVGVLHPILEPTCGNAQVGIVEAVVAEEQAAIAFANKMLAGAKLQVHRAMWTKAHITGGHGVVETIGFEHLGTALAGNHSVELHGRAVVVVPLALAADAGILVAGENGLVLVKGAKKAEPLANVALQAKAAGVFVEVNAVGPKGGVGLIDAGFEIEHGVDGHVKLLLGGIDNHERLVPDFASEPVFAFCGGSHIVFPAYLGYVRCLVNKGLNVRPHTRVDEGITRLMARSV